jgi:hypothetical protein
MTDETNTRLELEAMYPLGTVNVQVDDVVRPLDEAEWKAWIEQQLVPRPEV